jgi:hypothetical protein
MKLAGKMKLPAEPRSPKAAPKSDNQAKAPKPAPKAAAAKKPTPAATKVPVKS